MSETQTKAAFQIFWAKDGTALEETGAMSLPEFTPTQIEGLMGLHAPDQAKGEVVKVLVDLPGFHLTHVWFKKDFPLPRHSHDSDCLYYIIAGSIRLGKEWLGPRDSFFVPADVPYTYTPGDEGVELLEFRHATHFDFNLLVDSEAFWKRAVETAKANNDVWRDAKMPALNVED